MAIHFRLQTALVNIYTSRDDPPFHSSNDGFHVWKMLYKQSIFHRHDPIPSFFSFGLLTPRMAKTSPYCAHIDSFVPVKFVWATIYEWRLCIHIEGSNCTHLLSWKVPFFFQLLLSVTRIIYNRLFEVTFSFCYHTTNIWQWYCRTTIKMKGAFPLVGHVGS